MADPVLLIYRRLLETVASEASRTSQGFPTDAALAALAWIKEPTDKPSAGCDPTEHLVYGTTLEGVCEMLGLDAKIERKRMLEQVKKSYADAAIRHIRTYVNGRLAAVLACAGRDMKRGQLVLGLVDEDAYEDIAWVDRPDPPQRARRTKQKRAKAA